MIQVLHDGSKISEFPLIFVFYVTSPDAKVVEAHVWLSMYVIPFVHTVKQFFIKCNIKYDIMNI